MKQAQALDILKTGVNVFLTGEPGSGKTYVVNQYAAWLRTCGIEPAITASTGIAATHIGGMTIHSWTGIGVAERLSPDDVRFLAARTRLAERLRRANVLIIDEVSMLSASALEMADAVCRAARGNDAPFGGLQAVLTGDFFQLPPVARDGRAAPFAYESETWHAMDLIVCYLTEQHRQAEKDFLELLCAIRGNRCGDAHRARVLARRVNPHAAPSGMPKLFSHNADVDRINSEELAKLPGEPVSFFMRSRGPQALVAQLRRGCLSPERLELKKGAEIMFTKNNPQRGFVNGTLGTIAGFDEESGYPIAAARDGGRIRAEPMEWSIEENGKKRASIEQVPLRLAWAMTVHKSQGMSLDAAVVDLSQAFEYGQGYVAFSRVRRLAGLYVLGVNERAFLVHPSICREDAVFRTASAAAEKPFSEMPPKDLRALQEQFVRRCGGNIAAEGVGRELRQGSAAGAERDTSFLAHVRKTHPNAYRPWSVEDDGTLRTLSANGVKTADLARRFGRQRGAIRSRLVKLGLAATARSSPESF